MVHRCSSMSSHRRLLPTTTLALHWHSQEEGGTWLVLLAVLNVPLSCVCTRGARVRKGLDETHYPSFNVDPQEEWGRNRCKTKKEGELWMIVVVSRVSKREGGVMTNLLLGRWWL